MEEKVLKVTKHQIPFDFVKPKLSVKSQWLWKQTGSYLSSWYEVDEEFSGACYEIEEGKDFLKTIEQVQELAKLLGFTEIKVEEKVK